MNKAVGYVGVVLALVGLIWTASGKWQELQDRVKVIEEKQLYLHGEIILPKGP